jgi:DNA-binding CsgD family transcriptional regulator
VFVEQVALRPIERRILRLKGEGVSVKEIARRFRRSSDHIDRVIGWARLPGRGSPTESETLRALERRVLRWRDQGAAYEDIGARFRRSPDFVERVEGFARYKLHSQ